MEASLFPTAPLPTEYIPHHEDVEQISVSVSRAGEAPRWLMSRLADFWLVCAGGGVGLLVVAGALVWRGDWELSLADLLLSELHLGATYGVIVRRRLWQRMPVDVVAVPVIILLATYAITLHGWRVLLVSSIVYVGAWHRTRQNLGIARHYQRLAGGPRSRVHAQILAAAMYLPMAAAVAYFTGTSPYHEGEEYIAVPLPACMPWILAALAAVALILYLGSETARVGRYGNLGCPTVHPAERWLVIANAVGFGSAYVLGAWTAPFILVLVLHHEVQYLAFTYATARAGAARPVRGVRANLALLVSFAAWPAVDVASWALCRGWDPPATFEPFLTAGLLAHYWLDGRIWTGRARRLGRV
jgi:hypothetical protein